MLRPREQSNPSTQTKHGRAAGSQNISQREQEDTNPTTYISSILILLATVHAELKVPYAPYGHHVGACLRLRNHYPRSRGAHSFLLYGLLFCAKLNSPSSRVEQDHINQTYVVVVVVVGVVVVVSLILKSRPVQGFRGCTTKVPTTLHLDKTDTNKPPDRTNN